MENGKIRYFQAIFMPPLVTPQAPGPFGLSAWFCQGTFFQHLIGLWLSPTIWLKLTPETLYKNKKTRTLHGSFLQMAVIRKPLEHLGRPVESTPPFPSICHHPTLRPAGWEPQGAIRRSQWKSLWLAANWVVTTRKIGSMLKNHVI